MVDLDRIDNLRLLRDLDACNPQRWLNYGSLQRAWLAADYTDRCLMVLHVLYLTGRPFEVERALADAIRVVVGARWPARACHYSRHETRGLTHFAIIDHCACLPHDLVMPLLTWEFALDLLELIDITRGLPMKKVRAK